MSLIHRPPDVDVDGHVRATLIDADLGKEKTIEDAVLRRYPLGEPIVSAPSSTVPSWAGVGTEIVAGRNGKVVDSYTVLDVGGVDLSKQDVDTLPDEWDFHVTSFYDF